MDTMHDHRGDESSIVGCLPLYIMDFDESLPFAVDRGSVEQHDE